MRRLLLVLIAGAASPLRAQMHMPHPMEMNAGPLGIPETRMGSGTSGRPVARSAAPARPVHGALGPLRAAGGPESCALALPRARRRAGGGSRGLPAPAVRGGRSAGADLPSLAGRHPHHLWGRDRRGVHAKREARSFLV